jgi:hypothetical protein
MALGPMIQGQTRPSWTITIKQSNNSPLDITGATVTGVLYDKVRTSTVTLTGVFTITDGSNGVFVYSPAAADTVTPGVFEVEFKLVISTQIYYLRAPKPLTIKERYAA